MTIPPQLEAAVAEETREKQRRAIQVGFAFSPRWQLRLQAAAAQTLAREEAVLARLASGPMSTAQVGADVGVCHTRAWELLRGLKARGLLRSLTPARGRVGRRTLWRLP